MTISTPGVPERTAAFRGVPRRTRAFWAAHHCPEARESQRNAPKPHSWPRRAGDGPRDFLLGQNDNLDARSARAYRGVPRRTAAYTRARAFWAAQRRGEAKGMPKTRIRGRGEARRSVSPHTRVRARARPPPSTPPPTSLRLGNSARNAGLRFLSPYDVSWPRCCVCKPTPARNLYEHEHANRTRA